MPEWKQEIRARLASMKLEPMREAEIVEELSQHLEDSYAELRARGATPEEAYRVALAELSEPETLHRELSRVERQIAPDPIVPGTNRRTNMIADIWQDLRYGARMLVKSKGVTIIAVLSLAAGIGANTVIFSIVNAILLRPRPVAQPDQLVELYTADPELIGKTITLNNLAFTIIGIAPREFTGMMRGLACDVWAPAMMMPQLEPKYGLPMLTHRGNHWITIIGRLKPGVTLEQARARFDLLTREMRDAHPEEWRPKREETGETDELSVTILPESETRIPPEVRAPVYALIALLMVIVNLVLLIACMNLANLLLARAVTRRKEIAVRLAMGASRFRLIRQLLTESVLLALIAGAAGVALALWLINLLIAFMPPLPEGVRVALDVRLDWHVLLYTLVFSTLTGMLFGLAPALQASKADVVKALKDESSVFAGGYRQSRLRNGLVVTQIALSLLLLIGAGLTLRSLEKLRPTRMGFESENVLIAHLTLDEEHYDRPRSQEFYRRLSERIAALPGV